MPIPFLSSINLTKNEVENFKIYNLANDPGTLTSGGDFGYFWLNTSSQKTLKWWDGANVRSIVDSTNIGSYTSGLATDLAGGAGGYLPYQAGTNDTTFLPLGTAAQILAVNSGLTGPEWINQSSMSVGSATTATTANAVANALTAGSYLTSGGTYNGSVARTFAVDATDANTASKVVARDASGNFAAGTITAAKVTGLSAPTAGSDAANRDYVDSVAQGLDVKASCKAATVSNINLASPGATIDTVSLSVDNRVLVKDQSAPAENGIYLWKGAAVAMVRSPDADTWDDLVGAFTFVEEGTAANADSGWVCTVNAGGTLGSTAVTFVKFSQAGSYTAGNGIVQSGTSFNFAQSAAYTAGQIPFAGGTLGTSSTTIGFDSNFVWDDQANRLGIGTATPSAPLHVEGANIILKNGTGVPFFQIAGRNTDGRAEFNFLNNGLSVNNAKLVGYTNTLAFEVAGSERLRIASDGVCTWSNVGGVAGTAMTLNGTGLGVGASPSSRLTVASVGSSGNSTIESSCIRTNVGGTFSCFIGHDTTANRPLIQASSGNAGSAIDLLIQPYGGNVGIGTATPAYPLSVNGRISYIGAIGEGADTTLSSSSTGLLHGNSSYWTEHRFYASGNEQHRIAQSGVFTWYDGAGGTRMTLNGTGLGVGVSPNTILHVRKDFAGYTTIKAENQHTIAAGTGISFTINDGGTDASWFRRHRDGTGNTDIGYNAALRFRGQVTATERTDMLIDTSGNVGIGTASPSISGGSRRALTLNSPSGQLSILELAINGTLGGYLFSNGSITTLNSQSTAPLTFETNGAERLRIDSSGNLGLGVSPSAWNGYYRAFQIGDNGTALSTFQSSFTGNKTAHLTTNAYATYSGSGVVWNYITNNWASGRLTIHNNIFEFHQAAASTGVIGYTQAMTLDASGNLLVGTASASGSLTVVGAQSVDGSTYYIASLAANNAPVAGRGSGLAFRTNVGTFTPLMCAIEGVKENGTTDDYASALDFSTRVNGGFMTKRLRIDSNGNVGIGTTNPIIVAGTVVGISRDQNSATLLTVSNQANNASNSAGIDIESFGGGWRIAVTHSATYTNPLLFSMGGNERMRLTSEGNLGLGVTPSGQGGSGHIQLPNAASIISQGKTVSVITNGYYDTGWKCYANGNYTQYYATDGAHVFLNGSGTTTSLTPAERLRIKPTGQVRFAPIASAPASPDSGDVYYDSTTNRLRYYNGTAWVDSGTRKYSTALAGTSTTFDVTHNLGTQDVTVMVRKSASTFDVVYTDIQVATTNKVTIVFASSVTGSDYTVTVIG